MKYSLAIVSLFIILYSLFPSVVFAQALNIWEGTSGGGCNQASSGCNLCDAIIVAQNIIQMLFELAVPIAVAVIVWGAFLFITAGGSEERVGKGKKTMTAAVIGLVIALAAWIIVNTILHVLTGDINFPWADVSCKW